MAKYGAFIRGIGPGNPNMRNDKLRGVFEELGFTNVKSVISSGNILFESLKTDTRKFEEEIEKALNNQLGITGRTIIRSIEHVQSFVRSSPFGNLRHSPETYLLVTLLKQEKRDAGILLPYVSDDKSFRLISFDKKMQALYSITDTTRVKTPDFMGWMEKQYGKDITSRTWKTMERMSKQ